MFAVALGADLTIGPTQHGIVGAYVYAHCPVWISLISSQTRCCSATAVQIAANVIVVKFFRLPWEKTLLEMLRKSCGISGRAKGLVRKQPCSLMVPMAILGIPLPLGDQNRRSPGTNEAHHFFKRGLVIPFRKSFRGTLGEAKFEDCGEIGLHSVDFVRFQQLPRADQAHSLVLFIPKNILPAVSSCE